MYGFGIGFTRIPPADRIRTTRAKSPSPPFSPAEIPPASFSGERWKQRTVPSPRPTTARSSGGGGAPGRADPEVAGIPEVVEVPEFEVVPEFPEEVGSGGWRGRQRRRERAWHANAGDSATWC